MLEFIFEPILRLKSLSAYNTPWLNYQNINYMKQNRFYSFQTEEYEQVRNLKSSKNSLMILPVLYNR